MQQRNLTLRIFCGNQLPSIRILVFSSLIFLRCLHFVGNTSILFSQHFIRKLSNRNRPDRTFPVTIDITSICAVRNCTELFHGLLANRLHCHNLPCHCFSFIRGESISVHTHVGLFVEIDINKTNGRGQHMCITCPMFALHLLLYQ
jgi:hypothetical protein